jgi:hypothetical protein
MLGRQTKGKTAAVHARCYGASQARCDRLIIMIQSALEDLGDQAQDRMVVDLGVALACAETATMATNDPVGRALETTATTPKSSAGVSRSPTLATIPGLRNGRTGGWTTTGKPRGGGCGRKQFAKVHVISVNALTAQRGALLVTPRARRLRTDVG